MLIPPPIRSNDYGVCRTTDLTVEVADALISLHRDDLNRHVVGRVQQSNTNVVDIGQRKVDAWVIHQDFAWVDTLIAAEVARLNNTIFQFDVTGLVERPQLLRYRNNGLYDWHLDIGAGDNSTRKLSISYILNDGFEGGDLVFFQNGEQPISSKKGEGVCFPSFYPHRVQPVTSGERWALVAWISGTPFR